MYGYLGSHHPSHFPPISFLYPSIFIYPDTDKSKTSMETIDNLLCHIEEIGEGGGGGAGDGGVGRGRSEERNTDQKSKVSPREKLKESIE